MPTTPTTIPPTRRIAACCTLALTLGLGGCELFRERPTPSLVEPRAAVPRDFLFSWHEPYNEWMDAPVRVYYNKIPLDQVLANPPFTRLRYTVVERPDKMPLVTMDSLGISRRQLLWSIAHDYNLHMSLKTLPDGHPNEVLIRYRGDGGSKIRYGRTIR